MALSAFGPSQRRVLWHPVVAVGVVAPVCVLVSGLVAGPAAALAALGGMALALAFFAVSVCVVLVVDEVAPRALLGAAVGSYAVKIAILVPVLSLASSPVTRALAWTVLACALAWQVGHVTGLLRARILYFDPVVADDPHTGAQREDGARGLVGFAP